MTDTPAPPADVAATFCATLVDEWVRLGVRHAVVAPGSRSTPMALALASRPELVLHVVHDERVAGFVALGLGLDGTPAVVLCTSGTAAANLHPAVVEAGLSEVPMLVVTADRPPELRDVGAPQTVDQTHLYGRSVRWFHDPGVPDPAARGSWRSLAARAMAAAPAGPVHLNLPFREPLLGTPGALPAPSSRRVAAEAPVGAEPTDLTDLPGGRVVVVAGAGAPRRDVELLDELVVSRGWPVLADPLSGLRSGPNRVSAFDPVLRSAAMAQRLRPDLVVRLGRPPASRVLSTWLAATGAPVVQVGGPGVIDPGHDVVACARLADLVTLPATRSPGWVGSWTAADTVAERTIEEVLAAAPLSEPSVARLVAGHRPVGARLVVASSMPVRDLEWFGGPTAVAHANRGANGIDGVVSTALGIALGGSTVVALVGDVAALHDANALLALARRGADLRVVVVDNDGGGIFSFLPQAEALPPERFEQLFGTPHGTDVVALAAAHGLPARTVDTPAAFVAALAEPGPHLVRVATDRAANRALHAELERRVVAAVEAALDR